MNIPTFTAGSGVHVEIGGHATHGQGHDYDDDDDHGHFFPWLVHSTSYKGAGSEHSVSLLTVILFLVLPVTCIGVVFLVRQATYSDYERLDEESADDADDAKRRRRGRRDQPAARRREKAKRSDDEPSPTLEIL